MYGSDGIAGVLNFISPKRLPKGKLKIGSLQIIKSKVAIATELSSHISCQKNILALGVLFREKDSILSSWLSLVLKVNDVSLM